MSPPGQDRLLPFSTPCPDCGEITHGKVRSWLCLGGDSPFPDKVSGLILHRCEHCGKQIGSIMSAAGGKAEVLESGDGPRMQLDLLSKLIAARERATGGSPASSSPLRRGWMARVFGRFRR